MRAALVSVCDAVVHDLGGVYEIATSRVAGHVLIEPSAAERMLGKRMIMQDLSTTRRSVRLDDGEAKLELVLVSEEGAS